MAKVINGMWSGTLGGNVFVNTRHGQIVRTRPRRPWCHTPARTRSICTMASVAGQWRRCAEQQKAAWTAAGREHDLSGYHFFCQTNCHRRAAGLPVAMDPPKPKKRGPRAAAKR